MSIVTVPVKFTSFFLPKGNASARAVSVDVELDKAPGPVTDRALYTLNGIDVHYVGVNATSTHLPNNYVDPELIEQYQREEWTELAIDEYIENYDNVCDDIASENALALWQGK